MSDRNIRKVVTFSDQEYAHLADLAKREGRDLCSMIRWAIRCYDPPSGVEIADKMISRHMIDKITD